MILAGLKRYFEDLVLKGYPPKGRYNPETDEIEVRDDLAPGTARVVRQHEEGHRALSRFFPAWLPWNRVETVLGLTVLAAALLWGVTGLDVLGRVAVAGVAWYPVRESHADLYAALNVDDVTLTRRLRTGTRGVVLVALALWFLTMAAMGGFL